MYASNYFFSLNTRDKINPRLCEVFVDPLSEQRVIIQDDLFIYGLSTEKSEIFIYSKLNKIVERVIYLSLDKVYSIDVDNDFIYVLCSVNNTQEVRLQLIDKTNYNLVLTNNLLNMVSGKLFFVNEINSSNILIKNPEFQITVNNSSIIVYGLFNYELTPGNQNMGNLVVSLNKRTNGVNYVNNLSTIGAHSIRSNFNKLIKDSSSLYLLDITTTNKLIRTTKINGVNVTFNLLNTETYHYLNDNNDFIAFINNDNNKIDVYNKALLNPASNTPFKSYDIVTKIRHNTFEIDNNFIYFQDSNFNIIMINLITDDITEITSLYSKEFINIISDRANIYINTKY